MMLIVLKIPAGIPFPNSGCLQSGRSLRPLSIETLYPSPSKATPDFPSSQLHTCKRHMGRIENSEAAISPQGRRGVPFTASEVAQLVQEVRERREIIYGTKDESAKLHQARRAWEEIAEIISSTSNIQRSSHQCRKRFNDIKRRGQMMVAGRKRGRPTKNRPTGDNVSPILESNMKMEPEDLEFEINVLDDDEVTVDDDDPDYEPIQKKRELKIILPKEIPKAAQFDPPATASFTPPSKPKILLLTKPQTPPLPKAQNPSQPKPQTPTGPKPQTPAVPKPQTPTAPYSQSPSQPKPQAPSLPKPQNPSQPKPQTTTSLKPKLIVRKPVSSGGPSVKYQEDDKHPFLELQQAGFDMLKRELSGFRDSVMSLNTRLNHLEVALRPIGQISDSLARIANAVERLTCPPE